MSRDGSLGLAWRWTAVTIAYPAMARHFSATASEKEACPINATSRRGKSPERRLRC